MQIDHSKSQPMDDKRYLKLAWSRYVIQFKFQVPKHISGITEARIVKFLTQVGYIKYYQKDDISTPKRAWLWSRDCFKNVPFAVMQRFARVCQRQLRYRPSFLIANKVCNHVIDVTDVFISMHSF